MRPADPNVIGKRGGPKRSRTGQGKMMRGHGTLPYAPDLTSASKRSIEAAAFDEMCKQGKRLKPPGKRRVEP